MTSVIAMTATNKKARKSVQQKISPGRVWIKYRSPTYPYHPAPYLIRPTPHGGSGQSGGLINLSLQTVKIQLPQQWPHMAIFQTPETTNPRLSLGKSGVCVCRMWRWRRDSNSRYNFLYTHFPGVLLKPLGHFTVSLQTCSVCRGALM